MVKPEDVVSLDLSDKKFFFSGLAGFASLQELNVSNTMFDRVDILAGLPYLRVVDLTNTTITDLSTVESRIINGSLTVIGKDAEIRRIYESKTRLPIKPRKRIAIPKSPFKLKILIFGLPLSILCGVTSVQKDLARVLVLAGHEVLMLNYFPVASKDFNLVLCRVEEDELKLEVIVVHRDLDVILRNMQELKFYPDVIHAHTHTIQSRGMLNILLIELENPPLVYTIHDLLPYRQILVDYGPEELLTGGVDPNAIRRAIDLSYYTSKRNPGQIDMIKKADAIINVSESHQIAMGKIFGREIGKKTSTIKNTTPLWFILDSPEVMENAKIIREGIHKENNFVLFYSGRISKEKMIETLMLGFNKVCEEYPSTKLLLIGAGKDSDTMNSLVKSYGLNEKFIGNIIPTGWIKNIKEYAAYYLAGDILVQPGRTPNLYSISAIEAMAARKPVVTVPGELSSGIADNPKNLYKSVVRIMESYSFYERYCNEIYVKALDVYGPIRFLNEHLKLYSGLLKEKPKILRLLRRAGKKQLENIGFLYDRPKYEFRMRYDSLKTKTDALPPIEGIGEKNCAKYARLAAEKLFGLKYASADAWDMGIMPGNYVVWRKNESKEDYHKVIKPGDLVGIYLRTSPENMPNRSYTHMALYLGEGKVLHQRGKDVFISNLDRVLSIKHNCVLKAIIRTDRTVAEAA